MFFMVGGSGEWGWGAERVGGGMVGREEERERRREGEGRQRHRESE